MQSVTIILTTDGKIVIWWMSQDLTDVNISFWKWIGTIITQTNGDQALWWHQRLMNMRTTNARSTVRWLNLSL